MRPIVRTPFARSSSIASTGSIPSRTASSAAALTRSTSRSSTDFRSLLAAGSSGLWAVLYPGLSPSRPCCRHRFHQSCNALLRACKLAHISWTGSPPLFFVCTSAESHNVSRFLHVGRSDSFVLSVCYMLWAITRPPRPASLLQGWKNACKSVGLPKLLYPST